MQIPSTFWQHYQHQISCERTQISPDVLQENMVPECNLQRISFASAYKLHISCCNSLQLSLSSTWFKINWFLRFCESNKKIWYRSENRRANLNRFWPVYIIRCLFWYIYCLGEGKSGHKESEQRLLAVQFELPVS
jgi:hypothetical protein